jgi:exosome complex component RRP42
MASTSLSKAEKTYIQSSLLTTPPLRGDGRSLEDFRAVALETGVSPLANGSARLCIGRNSRDSGTEVLAAVKLEVEEVEDADGVDGGRIICTVSWYVIVPLVYEYCNLTETYSKTVLLQHTRISQRPL